MSSCLMDSDLRVEPLEVRALELDTVEYHALREWVVESLDEREHGRLPRARRAGERTRLSRRELEIDVAHDEHVRPRRVVEVDVLE
jgi:hypothetical protein